MKQIIGPLAFACLGILFGLFVPGEYNGHAISTIGWVVAGISALAAVLIFGYGIRQQNVYRKVYSNLVNSNRTRMFMGDDTDHIPGDGMSDRPRRP